MPRRPNRLSSGTIAEVKIGIIKILKDAQKTHTEPLLASAIVKRLREYGIETTSNDVGIQAMKLGNLIEASKKGTFGGINKYKLAVVGDLEDFNV